MQARHEYERTNHKLRQADFPSMKDLLHKQSKGKVPLTREEKLRLQKYANAKRKERN